MSWQADLDRLFPVGASVTQIRPQDKVDDAPQFFVPRFVVRAEEEHPMIHCNIVDFQKDLSFRLIKIEEVSPGTYLFHVQDAPNLMVSVNFGERIRSILKDVRTRWYGEGV